jgi:hypothetical protein
LIWALISGDLLLQRLLGIGLPAKNDSMLGRLSLLQEIRLGQADACPSSSR